MSKKDLFLVAGGFGVLYLLSKSRPMIGTGTGAGVQGGPSTSPVGGLVGGLTNIISNLFGGGYNTGIPVSTVSNPGINVISNPGSYPSYPPNYGTYSTDSGDPCDPSSVQYNVDVCAEMGG